IREDHFKGGRPTEAQPSFGQISPSRGTWSARVQNSSEEAYTAIRRLQVPATLASRLGQDEAGEQLHQDR
ncbi:MAG: hypothetical protein ACR2PL_16275, partial [Dehalococcoidia bacterium]